MELITVDAVVLDGAGRPVPGLTRDDFTVSEDGRPQEIVAFEAFVPGPETPVAAVPAALASNETVGPGQGRAFAILLDDLRLVPALARGARDAATSFLERAVRDGDEVTIGTTSGDAWWSARIPEGREDLLAVLGRLRGREIESTSLDRMTEYEAFWINHNEDSPSFRRLLPDRPDSAPAGAGADEAPLAGSSIKERVKARWKAAYLCSGTSCESVVRAQAVEIDGRRASRTRATLQAVRRGLDALASVRGRKSLLLLSAGFLDDSAPELRSVAAAAREANTAVYFIDLRGLVALPGGGSAADAEWMNDPSTRAAMAFEDTVLAAAGASALADETGGFSVRNTNDLAGGAERIAEESRVFYLLGFHPAEGKSPREWRKLRVEVKKTGLTVRARRGYALRAAAPKGEGKAGRKEGRKPSLDPAVARALDSGHDAAGIPLRAMAYVFEPGTKDTTRVLVAAEFDATRGPLPVNGRGQGGRLELSVVVTHRDTGREFRFDDALGAPSAGGEAAGWRAIAREFELPAGVAQARVVVHDPASGALGSVSQRFEVPPDGAFRLSTPILTDRVEPAADGRSRPRPALAVHRVFPPAGNLYCQYEVFGAAPDPGQGAPRVTGGLVLSTRDGRVVLQAPPTPIAADPNRRLVRLVGMKLDGLEAGAYDLVLEVRDEVSGARQERREPFTLAREAAASR